MTSIHHMKCDVYRIQNSNVLKII